MADRPSAIPHGGRRPRLHNIQYLRAFAALMVVGFHASLSANIPGGSAAVGVEIFFVISGFLMVAITDEKSRPWPFLKDRMIRVVPIYWLATAAAFFAYGGATTEGSRAIDDLIASFLFLPWGERTGRWFFPVLNVGWTLNYEMFFYALFALTLFVPRRWQLALLTLLFVLFRFAAYASGGDVLPWAFWGDVIIFDFLAGAFLAAGWRARGKWGLCMVLAALLAVLLPWATWSGLWTRAVIPPIASTVVAVAVLLERPRAPFRLPLLLGDASYSIYLWHYFAVLIAARIAGPVLPPHGVLVVCFLAGTAAGLAAHFAIERPLLRAARALRWRQGAPVPGGV